MGVIYRHPSMDLNDFNCSYLNKVLENISKEQSILLLVDFSVNLLNYDKYYQTNEFLDFFAIIPNMFGNIYGNKFNIDERN